MDSPCADVTISDFSPEDYMVAILLRLHSKITCLLLFTIMAANECTFDKYSTCLKDILSLCKTYFTLPDSSRPSASLSYGVLFPLFIVAVGFTARTCAHVLRYSFGWFEFSCSKRIYLRVCDTFTRSFHASLRPEYSSDASMCIY